MMHGQRNIKLNKGAEP